MKEGVGRGHSISKSLETWTEEVTWGAGQLSSAWEPQCFTHRQKATSQ